MRFRVHYCSISGEFVVIKDFYGPSRSPNVNGISLLVFRMLCECGLILANSILIIVYDNFMHHLIASVSFQDLYSKLVSLNIRLDYID